LPVYRASFQPSAIALFSRPERKERKKTQERKVVIHFLAPVSSQLELFLAYSWWNVLLIRLDDPHHNSPLFFPAGVY
jgi:hypothetical protein